MSQSLVYVQPHLFVYAYTGNKISVNQNEDWLKATDRYRPHSLS